MNKVMLDLETMGTGLTSAVVQIGVAHFDKYVHYMTDNINLESELRAGFKVDGPTIHWWLRQSDAARKSLEDNKALSYDTWEKLNLFLHDVDEIWSHATFDFVIMMYHFRVHQIKPLFSFRVARDIRTLVSLSGFDLDQWKINHPRMNIEHNALDDCYYQIEYYHAALRKLHHED